MLEQPLAARSRTTCRAHFGLVARGIAQAIREAVLRRDAVRHRVDLIHVDELEAQIIDVVRVCLVEGPGELDALTSVPNGVLGRGGDGEAVVWLVAVPCLRSSLDGECDEQSGAQCANDAGNVAGQV